jgi:hypothetical protein
MEEPISQAEILRKIQSTQNFLECQPPELIRQNIYKAMQELSSLTFLQKSIEIESLELNKYISRVENYLSSVNQINRNLSLIMGEFAVTKNKYNSSIIFSIKLFLEAMRLLIITNRFDDKILLKFVILILGIDNILHGLQKDGLLKLLEILNNDLYIFILIARTSLLMYIWIKPSVHDINIPTQTMLIEGWNYMLEQVEPFDANNSPREFIKQLPENVYSYYLGKVKTRRFYKFD